MIPGKFRIASVLSNIILTLAALTSAGGLFIPDLYRDSETIRRTWVGNDLVTLLVIVPMLLVAVRFSLQGAMRAQLVWAGLLAYTLYNYAFYLFGTAFNRFFLLYSALFTLSLYALILVLSNLDAEAIQVRFGNKRPLKPLSLFMVLMALPLLTVEGGQAINFVFTGKLPEIPTLIFALDLSFVIPNLLLSAVLLWKRHRWGVILGAVMLVKGITYGLVLITATASVAGFSFSGHWDPLLPFYLFVFAGSLVACVFLLRNVQPGKHIEAFNH
jgi:hypothetical protein